MARHLPVQLHAEFLRQVHRSRPLDPLQLTNNNITTSGGVANYNAMFVTLRKSMSRGLDLSVNYTWSHSLGTAGVNSLGQQYTGYTPPTPFDFYSGYGSQNGDRRHVINASWYYELPFGRGQHFLLFQRNSESRYWRLV